eukprot:1590917-Prymnesium_polylepis.1
MRSAAWQGSRPRAECKAWPRLLRGWTRGYDSRCDAAAAAHGRLDVLLRRRRDRVGVAAERVA